MCSLHGECEYLDGIISITSAMLFSNTILILASAKQGTDKDNNIRWCVHVQIDEVILLFYLGGSIFVGIWDGLVRLAD